MIRKLSSLISDREKILSFKFGEYGADRLIPPTYQEGNVGITPFRCSCVVMKNDCADSIYRHLSIHYSSSIAQMKKRDGTMEESFRKNFKERYCSDMKLLDDFRNLSFGNFFLHRTQTVLGTDFVMVFPDDIIGMKAKDAIVRLECYLIGNGILPDRASEYTPEALDMMMSHAIRREGDTLSGVYSLKGADIGDGRVMHAVDMKDGHIRCHFRKSVDKGGDVLSECMLKEMKPEQVQRIRPLVEDFRKVFSRNIRTLSDSQVPRNSQKKTNNTWTNKP